MYILRSEVRRSHNNALYKTSQTKKQIINEFSLASEADVMSRFKISFVKY